MQDLAVVNLSKRNKNIILLLIDMSIILISYFLSVILNNDASNVILQLSRTLPISIIIYVLFLKRCRMYSSIWINAGSYELMQSIIATVSACVVSTILMLFIPNSLSAIVNITAGILIMLLVTGVRLSLRVITRFITYTSADRTDGKYNVLIIGAGDCASSIISEIRKEKRQSI